MNKIIQGDTLEELKKLPDEYVDLIITSPPYYNLRDYQTKGQIGLEKTFQEYLDKMLKITAELKRVLKKTGQFWLNMGDCYGSHRDWSCSDKKRKKEISQHQEGIIGYEKCLLMQPERLSLAMVDQQGWILRNKVKWAKQILIGKERRTMGSVMPTSVKDRFNESGEELYFFVKNKKYWSDLDAVRLRHQTELNMERPRMGQGGETIYEQKRAAGIIRQRDYPESKFNKFNYRVRDAKRKSKQCPQFKATEEEIKRYDKGSEYEQKYGEPWDRFGKNTKKARKIDKTAEHFIKKGSGGNVNLPWKPKTLEERMEDTKNKDTKRSPAYNMKKLLSEVRLGIKPNTGMVQNKVNDPRGTHEGGPGSWRDNLDDQEYRKRWKGQKEAGVPATYIGPTRVESHPAGKNIPTIHLIEEERNNFIPFSFEKQLTILGIKEFENLLNISTFVENQLINSSTGMKSGTDISANKGIKSVSDTIQEFLGARKIQPNLTLFRGSPYTTIAIKNTPNEISVIFGRNVWIFRRKGFSGSNASFNKRRYKWFAFNCNSEISAIMPLLNFVSGFQLGADYLEQLNVFRTKFKLKSAFRDITIGQKQAQEICGLGSNSAKVFFIESIFAMTIKIWRSISQKFMVMPTTKSTTNNNSPTSFDITDCFPHILNISQFFEKSNTLPTIWLIQSEPHNFQKELGLSVEHFAIFPQALLEIPIQFGCPKGGLILDPFMGSGTTAIVAKRLGRNYLGIELNKNYIKIAETRIKVQPTSLI